MSFCTVINCMDGRTQLPVNEFLRQKYNVDHVDTITEPGPVRILSDGNNSTLAESILKRVDISITKHKSIAIGIVAHYDCAGNPLEKSEQMNQLNSAIEYLKEKYPKTEIIGLWVDSEWKTEQVL